MLYTFLVLVDLIVAILLMVVVLMQSSKGGGLAGSFGGASAGFGNMFGVRRTADILTRATTILASVFIGLAFLINLFFLPNKSTDAQRSILQQRGAQSLPAQQVPSTPSVPLQSQPQQ